ncbi:CMD domain protein [Microbacterium panaciterrae]|uniref:CMD domain protein n=1 Tax=Microbacterium panaciterrae TaxID=985759 RepID=A0ABP8P0Q2_9MICO
MSDLIDDLVGIAPGSALDALRAKRPVARSDAQATYDGLITAPADLVRASAAERVAIGYWVAVLSRAGGLADHYRALLDTLDPSVRAALDGALPGALTSGPYGSYPEGPLSIEDENGLHWAAPADLGDAVGERIAAALAHAHLLTYRPRDASPDALQDLLDAGWSTDGVVTVSQLIAFTHFQLRVIAGLTVLKEAI